MWQRSVVTRRYIVLQSARRHVVLRCGNEWWRSGTSGGTQNQPLGTSQACVTSSGCTTRRRAGALGDTPATFANITLCHISISPDGIDQYRGTADVWRRCRTAALAWRPASVGDTLEERAVITPHRKYSHESCPPRAPATPALHLNVTYCEGECGATRGGACGAWRRAGETRRGQHSLTITRKTRPPPSSAHASLLRSAPRRLAALSNRKPPIIRCDSAVSAACAGASPAHAAATDAAKHLPP
ncbi:unnamed protein product [Arctia plantaginis]|uniref:Uncharacterized protein n=1 Tax=Arctia plantaginis TaxID=874455 RepID=A0A8S0ZA55_ARCPL|nr:unnamed protein product [Arctia plantaginis]